MEADRKREKNIVEGLAGRVDTENVPDLTCRNENAGCGDEARDHRMAQKIRKEAETKRRP